MQQPRGEPQPPAEWDNLGFQIRPIRGHVKYTHRDGAWDGGVLVHDPNVLLHINSGALHYGISCFEGLKAFSCKDGRVRVMNPAMNAARMKRGAQRLRMPEVPAEVFVEAVRRVISENTEFVPPYGHGASLYIRPLLFASGVMLGLAPLATEFTFLVTATPAGGYYSSAGGPEQGLDALVIEDHDRAASLGTGDVKAAGNYAADIGPVHMAKEQGYGTSMYLDAKEHKYIEEFGVTNFVGITRDGRYVTPLSGSILASTTNSMLQELARDAGITVETRPIDFEAEIDSFAEVGMVGTAAVVVRVTSITRGGQKHSFGAFDKLGALRSRFTAIQCGEEPDVHGWMLDVCAATPGKPPASRL